MFIKVTKPESPRGGFTLISKNPIIKIGIPVEEICRVFDGIEVPYVGVPSESEFARDLGEVK